MTQIIEKYVANFKEILASFSAGEDLSLDNAEAELTEQIYCLVAGYLGELYETKDEEIWSNKAQRKADGLVVERRGDKRQVLTVFGSVNFNRTYYRAVNGYEYPVDRIAGVEEYRRISNRTGIALVATACSTSYQNSSNLVTGGNVSRQTVMRAIRQMDVPQVEEAAEKKKVTELHIDADEDHVHLQSGKSVIVPVVCVYEGKVPVCKGRNRCVNAFHHSEYGDNYDNFWENVLAEIEARYDISETKVYLHADGGNWIQKAQDWIPNIVFVLDDYHKNKAIKKALSGIGRKEAQMYDEVIRESFLEDDATLLGEIRDSLIAAFPDRKATICDGINYLIRFFDAIHLRAANPKEVPGGSSEPHVQHVLSERLSSTPKAWSEETLKHFVPVLAARQAVFACPVKEVTESDTEKTKKPNLKNTAGLIDPDSVINFPASAYKQNALGETLKAFGRQHF